MIVGTYSKPILALQETVKLFQSDCTILHSPQSLPFLVEKAWRIDQKREDFDLFHLFGQQSDAVAPLVRGVNHL